MSGITSKMIRRLGELGIDPISMREVLSIIADLQEEIEKKDEAEELRLAKDRDRVNKRRGQLPYDWSSLREAVFARDSFKCVCRSQMERRMTAIETFEQTVARNMRQACKSPDNRPDNSGLDDGPNWERKKSTPKSSEEIDRIRAYAWSTRRVKYGERGHR